MTEHEFDVDTRVEAVADHTFAAAVTDRGSVLGGGPNGSYLLAICLQALARVMPAPDPVAVSRFSYVRRPPDRRRCGRS